MYRYSDPGFRRSVKCHRPHEKFLEHRLRLLQAFYIALFRRERCKLALKLEQTVTVPFPAQGIAALPVTLRQSFQRFIKFSPDMRSAAYHSYFDSEGMVSLVPVCMQIALEILQKHCWPF